MKPRPGAIVLFLALGIMMSFAIVGLINPAFYSPAKMARVNMLNTAGSRKIFTTYFYWYKSGGPDFNNSPHCAETWSTDPYPEKTWNVTYPAGWPGPTDPALMVQNVSATTGWHDSDTYHPPADLPLYDAAGNVIASSLKNGTMEHLGTWFDWNNASWHQWELRCMMRAGIDVLMPVYWWNGLSAINLGSNPWSIEGLRVLRDSWYDLAGKLVVEGQATNITHAYQILPKICLFYDVTCMKQLWSHNMSLTGNQSYNWYMENGTGANLNESYWQEEFWQNIDDFLDNVTSIDENCSFHWDNRYIVWLYS
nr:hypothetical protein [Candidatus Sigynarchaeota archaeon]